MANILILTKRQYTNKDIIDDLYGRLREIPFELDKMGHSVTGLCLSYKRRMEGLNNDGKVIWHSINAGKLKLVGLLVFIMQANRYAESADLIWACSDSFYGIIGQAISRKYKIPLIFDLYDNFEYFFAARLPIIKQLYRRAVRHSDAVTCVSKSLADLVENLYGKRSGVFILNNAIRNDLFYPRNRSESRKALGLPMNGKFIGTAGALTHNRGIENFFDAFLSMKKNYPDLHLAIAGPRDVVIPNDHRIHDLGLLPLETVPYLFNSLDVAVVCVKDDDFGRYCFPQKALEIMACDVPLIAASVGSLREIFEHSPEWLYQPGDSASLERAIENRLRDSRTGYEKPPTWSDMAKVFDALITSVLTRN